jgi:hypothetical protein
VIYEPPLVGSMSVRDWPGKLAGLKMMDRTVAADGRMMEVDLRLPGPP